MELTKRLLAYLCEITLVASCIIFLTFLPKVANCQGSSVIVDGADYTSTSLLQYPTGLNTTTQNVSARVVVEYADFLIVTNLQEPRGLPSTLSARVVVEYADFSVEFALKPVQGLSVTVAPRVIVEYADYSTILAQSPYLGPAPPTAEFPSAIILLLFMMATLCTVIIFRRKHKVIPETTANPK